MYLSNIWSYNHFSEIRKKILEKQKKGEHKGIRYVRNITQDNSKFVKLFLDAGIRIRQKSLLGMQKDYNGFQMIS
jgi:hypothetical protein